MTGGELILEQRGLLLGPREGYMDEVVTELEENFDLRFVAVTTEEELIEKCYTYEPMLILTDLTLQNLNILINASRIGRYKRSVSIALVREVTQTINGLIDSKVLTDAVTKSGKARLDASNISRCYKLGVKYGVNVKGMAGALPIVTELIWNDPSRDKLRLMSTLSDRLDRLGVRKELAGHRYLIAAIALQSATGCAPEPLKLYTHVAQYYETTPQAVEKAIRYAIETAWMVGDIELQHRMFGLSIDSERGKPTNAEFIARLAIDY